MINHMELRVGNKILDPFDNIVEVSEIRKDSLSLLNGDGGYFSSFSPIPLTPELLLKCGFVKYSHEPGYSIGSDKKSEKCDEYSLRKITIMDWGNGFILSNSFSFDLRIELKYLHQLQNLQYALTEKELTITL